MLQQTTVSTVKAYFENFIRIWPRINDLAKASHDDVMQAWAGLGYYARARNLHKTAQQISQLPTFPRHSDELIKYPGIGPYTAASIAAIAFQQPILPLDGNINRILARYHEIYDFIDRPSKTLKAASQQWAHPTRSGDIAQALMDIGATICRPLSPKCHLCPLQVNCRAFQKSLTNELPQKAPKRAKKKQFCNAFVVKNNLNQIAYVDRDQGKILGNMKGLPTDTWTQTQSNPEFPFHGDWTKIGTIKHIFTHIDLQMTVWTSKATHKTSPSEWIFLNQNEMPKNALARLWAKALELAWDVDDNHS